ncbi:DUF3450 family protein [Fibrobacterota bacterium]
MKTPVYIILGIFLIAAFSIPAQETLSSVQRNLDRVDREIQREKELHKLEKKKAQEFEKRRKEKLKAINAQFKNLDTRIGELSSKLGRLKKQKGSLNHQIKNLKLKRSAVAKHILRKTGELKVFFQNDFPYQREKRVSDLESLEQDIKENVVEPEEAMNRLFTLLEYAIAMGYDSEVYSGTYRAGDGGVYDGKYLRLGAVISTFVSIDGKMVGYLLRTDSSYTWIDSELGLDLKQNIKKAVKVAEGKSAPELVVLPFGAIEFRKEPAGE